MALLRSICRASSNLMSTKENFVWNSERYIGSKVEIPSPPKKPLSAYMTFCKDHRKEILKDNPSLNSLEQIKILAEKWSRLTEDMKKPFQIRARESTLLYGLEHKKFYEGLTEKQKEELARLKAKKLESRRNLRHKKTLRESGLPSSPLSAYALFVQSEAKNKSSEERAVEFIKRVANLWKNLPEASKKMYEKQAEEAKKRFLKDMKDWHTEMLSKNNTKILKAYEELKGKGKHLDFGEEATSKKPERKTTSEKKETQPESKN